MPGEYPRFAFRTPSGDWIQFSGDLYGSHMRVRNWDQATLIPSFTNAKIILDQHPTEQWTLVHIIPTFVVVPVD